MFAKKLLLIPFYAVFAAAICPGYNYGIGNVQNLGDGINKCESPLREHTVSCRSEG